VRLSGRKFANKFIEKKLKPTSETRDAIIFEVDSSAHVCKCRVQGSDEYVNAYYPRNEATIPSWMKPGNAVRILHRTGVRGHCEVIGHGGAIPTPVPGSPERPDTSSLANVMLTGGEVTAAGGMAATINDGTYRINGTTYTLSGGAFGYPIMSEANPPMTMSEAYPPAVMGDPIGVNYPVMSETDPPMVMSETDPPATMGIVIGTYTLDDMVNGAGWFRYDTFQVGEDGIVDYVKGAEANGEPTPPSISTDHVQVGPCILVIGGQSEIADANIGWEWTDPYASTLVITADDEFAWDAGNDYPEKNISVAMKDQYENTYADIRTFTLYLSIGTGQVWSLTAGYDSESVSKISNGGYTFKYRRDQTVTETSPSFMITASGSEGLVAFHNMILIGETGLEIRQNSGGGSYQEITSSGGAATVDWSEGAEAEITTTEDVTFTFSGTVEHRSKLTLLIRQDGTGGWTPTLPSDVNYGDQVTEEVVSTAANSRTYLGFIYDKPTDSYDLVAYAGGYS